MYLLKNDPVEIIEEKDNWLKIKYYPEKNGEWTGKTIEGWIKKSDVE
jgi:SH3-like domain-containing protein